MHLYKIFSSPNSATWHSLAKFREIIEAKEIWRPKEDIQFVFLCGANISPGTPSKRRQLLLNFSLQNLPNAKFFLAESIFQILKSEGHKSNFLDIENDLSIFSDYVVIILESESAFCELGAFATYQDLRKKLIIINDKKHIHSESFINLGPIKAISEVSTGKNILYYDMEKDGKTEGDSIGEIFFDLYKLIHKEPKTRRTRVKQCNPNMTFSKDTLRFIHDLIYLTGPLSIVEISKIIKILFSECKESQIRKHLGLLCATGQIERTSKNLYRSLFNRPFFEYGKYDIFNLFASFKNMYFKYNPERLL